MIKPNLRHLCLMMSCAALLFMTGCKPSDATIELAPKIGFIWIPPNTIPFKKQGYELKEYFFQGTATSYVSDEPLSSDGKWTVMESGESAAYKSRMIVFRPKDPEHFNGTVLIEWMNVSSGTDTPTEWITLHTELMRQGYAYVGVSAQYAGVEGGPIPLPKVAPLCLALKCLLKPRYYSLSHPGDSFSYDIFQQAAQLVRFPGEVNPLGELVPERLIAAGQSQSAHRLITLINSVGKSSLLFDGYFVHSRLGSGIPELGGGASAPLSQSPQADINTPTAVHIRDDLPVPVINIQAETDQIPLQAYLSRQPDHERFRLWEIAGSAHADLFVSSIGLSQSANTVKAAELSITKSPSPFIRSCPDNISTAPQHHFVAKAAIRGLQSWITEGTAPQSFPRLTLNNAEDGFETDARGNALGGVRSPYVDAPIARLSGLNNAARQGEALCYLFGNTEMLEQDTLRALYPTHADYMAAVTTTAYDAVDLGTLLPEDAELVIEAAQNADIPPQETVDE